MKKKTTTSPSVKADTPVAAKATTVTTTKVMKKDWVIPVLVGLIIVAAFAVGYLFGKVEVYEKLGTAGTTKAVAQAGEATPEPAVQVSMDKIKALFNDKKMLAFGNPEAKVVFVEFSDPSCPYCHIAAGMNPSLNKEAGERFTLKQDGGTYIAPVPEMKKLVDEGKAGFVWAYSNGHGNGELATQLLYCARDQQKFWEVHDLLMSAKGYDLINETVQNDPSKVDQLLTLLAPVADTAALKACIANGTYASQIQTDEALARSFGVSGTPGFFVNTQNYAGAYSFAEMQAAVDEALK